MEAGSKLQYALSTWGVAGANPSPSPSPAAPGSSKSSFTFHSSSRQSFIAMHFPIANRMDHNLFLCSEVFTETLFRFRLPWDEGKEKEENKKNYKPSWNY